MPAILEFDEEDAGYLTAGLDAEWRRMLLSEVEAIAEGNDPDPDSLRQVHQYIDGLKARINRAAMKAFNNHCYNVQDGLEPDDIPF